MPLSPTTPSLVRLAAACAAMHTATLIHAQTRTIYVDDDGPSNGDGESWDTAFRDLHDALRYTGALSEPVEIRVGQGLYRPDQGTGLQSLSFVVEAPVVQSGVTLWLRGGFAGRGAPNPDLEDPSVFVTVLSGDLKGDDGPNFTNREDNSEWVVRVHGLTDGSPKLSGLRIRGATDRGVGVGNAWPNERAWGPVFENCRIEDNGGGGLSQSAGRPVFRGCVFRGNRGSGWSGGGLRLYEYVHGAVLDRCQIIDNEGVVGAGLSFASGGRLEMRDCVVRGNLSTGTIANGGGMYVDGGLSLVNTLVAGNRTQGSGGGLYSKTGGQPIQRGTIVNSTFVDNEAVSGGGVLHPGVDLEVANSVFWGNAATATGASLWSAGRIAVQHTTIENGASGVVAVGAGLIQFGPGVISADPLFMQAAAGDYRLGPFSPCIDAGVNVAVPAGVTTDLSGNARFVNDPWVANTGFGAGAIADMGAYERQDSSCGADCNGDLALTVSDFACFQTRFVAGNLNADCNADGRLTVGDFGCFQTGFVVGCP